MKDLVTPGYIQIADRDADSAKDGVGEDEAEIELEIHDTSAESTDIHVW